MGRKAPLINLKDLGYNLPKQFACFPPIILDNVSTFWAVRGGNHLLAQKLIIGRVARNTVRKKFLMPKLLRDYLKLFRELV